MPRRDSTLHSDLEAALKATESSFHVRLIGTFNPDLACAPASAQAMRWLEAHHPNFDQFPVRRGGRTIGVLRRWAVERPGTVEDSMEPLSDEVMVASDTPIIELIPRLRENRYRLILRGGHLDGLVTQSDLLKLPVRMLLFGLISHLELCFRALVRRRFPDNGWLDHLGAAKKEAIEKKQLKLAKARLDPDLLELTSFGDVVEILGVQPAPGADFRAAAGRVRELRNDLAHAKTYVSSPAGVPGFVDKFVTTRELIHRVSHLLREAQ